MMNNRLTRDELARLPRSQLIEHVAASRRLLTVVRGRRYAQEHARVRAQAEEIRGRCKSLVGFVKEAWHVLEPGTPYVHNWHIDAICDHLEAVTRGEITRLLINVPPGSSKSMIVSVLWPAWEWAMGQRHLRFLTTSFAEGNVKRDTRKHRDLVLSAWFQALWPEVKLKRLGEMSFSNTDTGTREGVAFGSLTSRRGDRLIIDDPHSTQTAESDAEREETTRLFREGATDRLNDMAKSAIVVVMQRLHEMDVSGVILDVGMDYVHLMIPMEFEPARAFSTPWGKDPRIEDGQLMDAIRFSEEVCRKLRRDKGQYAYAGQYQQRPAPRSGGLFKRGWFPVVPVAPVNAKRCRAWDLAATEKKQGNRPDWTAGVRVSRDEDGVFYVEHVVRFQAGPKAVEDAILNTARVDRVACSIQLPQDPGQAGKAQALTLVKMLAGYDAHAKPVTGDKEMRARPAAAQAEAGNVRLVAGEWNEAFMDELCLFPAGAHDDQVDAFADALNTIALEPDFEWYVGQ